MKGAPFRPSGAFDFAVDPSLPAAEAEVFWRADAAPGVVLLLTSSPFGAHTLGEILGQAAAWRAAPDGLYLRFEGGLQAQVLSPAEDNDLLAALLPLGPETAIRAALAHRFASQLEKGFSAASVYEPHVRRRWRRMLRALDGRAEGASYRQIAAHILDARFTRTADWLTAPARDVAIRLTRSAVRLMKGGYRRFLRRRE